jgi:hypothetical protein
MPQIRGNSLSKSKIQADGNEFVEEVIEKSL